MIPTIRKIPATQGKEKSQAVNHPSPQRDAAPRINLR